MKSTLGCLGIPPIHDNGPVSLVFQLLEDGLHFGFEVLQFGVDGVLKRGRTDIFKSSYW